MSMNPVDNNPNLRGPRVDTNSSARRGAGVAPADSPNRDGADSADEVAAGESVSLTRAASDMLALETQLRELPGIDQARVDAIRQAIEDGTYEIDTTRLVDNLLQSERELR